MKGARVGAAILAGGAGRRMGGVTKSFLPVDGAPILERQLAVLRPLFERVVVVAADAPGFQRQYGGKLEVIEDRRGPGLGPLAGLDAALAWLPPQFDALVCVAGDMPFLAPALLANLRDAAPADAAAVVPRSRRGIDLQPHPLCARYHRSVAALVEVQLDAGARAMHLFLERLAAGVPPLAGSLLWLDEAELRRLDPDLISLTNINTPADLSGCPPKDR